MSKHAQVNIVQFYSKLESFRIAEKYTDVTIECDGKYFKCHRVTLATASNLFDTILTGKSEEGKEEMNVKLREVNAETFGEVLQFIYTGDVSITCANVCNLFKASKFFSITGLADLCVQFIKTNKMTVNATLRMYCLACQDKNETLIDILCRDIVEQFKIFTRASKFLEIPFHNFKTILSRVSSLSTDNEEALLGVILRWVSHRQEERSVYFKQLYKMIRFGYISTEVAGFVISKPYMDPDAVELGVETVDPLGYDDFTETPRKIVPSAISAEKKLHLFVKYAEENLMRIFSVDSSENCAISGAEVHTKNNTLWIRTIPLDDYLYCLHYIRRNSKRVDNNNQIFHAYTSVDMRSSMELNAPPVVFGDINFCRGRNNNIYAYNQTLFEPTVRTDSRCSAMFTDEELSRGIYLYNADLDIWLPVPAMQRKSEDACTTTYNGLLYLIGGTSDSADSASGKLVQTYDCREGRWRVVRSTNNDRVGADCCVFNDEVYVCGGKAQTTSVEKWDPRIEKWECLKAPMAVEMQHHRVISFSNKLWAIGDFIPGRMSVNSLSIQNYPNDVIRSVHSSDDDDSDSGESIPRATSPPLEIKLRSSILACERELECNSVRPLSLRIPTLSWEKKDMLRDVDQSTTGVIMDGIVF